MARQSIPPAEPAELPAFDIEREAAEQIATSAALAQIDKEFGDIVPYHRDRLIQETRFLLGQASDALLEAGRRLIQLKEHEGHGSFLEALEAINIHPRAAQRLMSASLKLSNTTTLSHLKNLPKSKILEIATLDDSEIKELGEGGTVRGIKLDDVDRMSVRELQMALRTQRERAEKQAGADKRLIDQKNGKIDELTRQLDQLQQERADEIAAPPDWDRRAQGVNVRTMVYADRALKNFDMLRAMLGKIEDLAPECGDGPYLAMARQYLACIDRMADDFRALADDAHAALGTAVEAAGLEAADFRLSDLPEVGEMVGEYLPADHTLN